MPPAAFDADLRHVVNINVGCPDSDSMSDTNLHDSIFCFKVLGGIMPKKALPSGSDLNNVVTSCVYEVAGGVSHTPYNYGTLICIVNDTSSYKGIQIFVRAGGTQMWERFLSSDEWSTWYEIAIDIPSFYKNYSSIDALRDNIGLFKYTLNSDNLSVVLPASVNGGVLYVLNNRTTVIETVIVKSWAAFESMTVAYNTFMKRETNAGNVTVTYGGGADVVRLLFIGLY